MSDVYTFGKKLFTLSVVAVTIAWSMGLAALVPAVAQAEEICSTLEAGDLYKVPGSSAVYLVSKNMGRKPFPSYREFKAWGYKDADVKMISVSCGSNYPSDGMVQFPAGYLVKNTTFAAVYQILPGGELAHIGNEQVAKDLYGTDWVKAVSDVADVFLDSYTDNKVKVSEAKLQNGMLAKVANGDVYYVSEGKKLKVDGTLPTASVVVRTISQTVFDTVETGSTTITEAEILSGATGSKTPPAPVSDGSVAVSLSADTPVAGYIAKGAYNADFTKITFKNTSSASVRVDKIVVKRDGLGVDADITAVRLYDGATQLGSDQALNTNTHLATFNNINWDIAAGVTKTLTVKADTSSSASGTNDYMSVTVIELEGAGNVSVSLPISGSAMQYHAVSVAVVDIDALASPGATTFISGSTEQQAACYNIDTNANEGVYLKSMSFTNNGTISNDEVSNFVVKQGADVLGKNTATFGSGGKVTVDMTTPYFIDKSKSKDVCVYVDIKSGLTVSKTLILQIAESKDVVVSGDSSKAQVVITKDNATTFTAQSSQTMTIGQGTLTVARNTATLPVAGSLIDGVTHNKVAAYKFSAGSTEGAKVTRLRLTVSGIDGTDWSNFELYKYDDATGKDTQVGSSQSISGSYVTFEDTSDGLFDVEASKNVVIHVYADVNSAAAWTANSAGVYIGTTNDNLTIKAKGMKSGDYVPAASVTLSSVGSTVSDNVLFTNANNGDLVISLANNSPSATSIAKGASNIDFAHYKLYATGEDVNVTQLVVRAYNTSGTGSTASTTNEFTNVKLYDMTSSSAPVQLGSTVVNPSSGVSTFSFTLKVPKDDYKIVKVVADVPTNSAGAGFLHFDVPGAGTIADDISSTGDKSGVDLTETGSATGKTMTIATPTVTVSWASGSTNNVVANSAEQIVGTLQLTAGQYEDVKITTIKVTADDATPVAGASAATSNFNNVKLVGIDGAQYGTTKSLTDGGASAVDYVQFEGITNLTVTKGTTKVVYVKANVAGTSGTYYVGTAATSDVAGSGVTSGNSVTVSGTGTGPANTIQTVATLAFALDASNPTTKLMAVGTDGNTTEETFLTLSADSVYEDVDITKLLLNVVSGSSSDLVQQAFKDNGVKLYHKVGTAAETLVGSGSVVSTTADGISTYYAVTFNITAGDLRIGKSTDDLLIVKGLLKGTDSGLTSAVSPLFRLGNGTNADDSLFVEARGVSSGTSLDDDQFNTTSAVNLSSNQLVAYRAYPTFTYVSPGTTLVSGVENDIYSFKVRATGGTVALKQLQFTIDIVDNVGTIDNSMAVHTFKLYRGDTNLTDNVKIHTASTTGEASLEGGSSKFSTATGTGKTFYVTWTTTNEETIPNGSEYTYIIKATAAGFNTDADNDYIRVRLANTDTSELSQANATYVLTSWNGGSQVTGGLTDLLTLTNTAGGTLVATSTPVSLIWSDRNSSSHTATTGTWGTATSSADWFNGYFVKDTPTNYSMLIR